MEVSKTRGRPRLEMLDDLITVLYVDMKQKVKDREGWKDYVPWTLGSTLRERIIVDIIIMIH